jgi:hypothetical protein
MLLATGALANADLAALSNNPIVSVGRIASTATFGGSLTVRLKLHGAITPTARFLTPSNKIELVRTSAEFSGISTSGGELEVPITPGSVGNTWVVVVYHDSEGILPGLTTSPGTSFSNDQLTLYTGENFAGAIFSGQIKSSAVNLITVHGLKGTIATKVAVYEFANIQGPGHDVVATTKVPTTSAVSSGTAINALSGDLVFGAFVTNQELTNFTPGEEATLLTGTAFAGASGSLVTSYKLNPANQAVQATGTIEPNVTTKYIGFVVGYRAERVLVTREQFSGVSAGVAQFNGTLMAHQVLSGTIAATASFNATLATNTLLVGSLVAGSSFGATLNEREVLAGLTAGIATFSGTLSAHGLLAGSIVSAGHFTGALAPRLTGGSTAAATFAGALGVRQRLVGQLSGSATLSGALTVHRVFIGRVESNATFAGSLAPKFTGSTAGSSTFASTLRTAEKLAGRTTASATFTGSLAEKVKLGGTTSVTAHFIAELSATKLLLSGTITCAADFTGGLSPRLVGATHITCTFSGLLHAPVRLVGSISCVGTFRGGTKQKLTTVMTSTAGFAGTLTERIGLAGSIASTATLAGGLHPYITGNTSGDATFAGELSAHKLELEGSIACNATFSGELGRRIYSISVSVQSPIVLNATAIPDTQMNSTATMDTNTTTARANQELDATATQADSLKIGAF